MYRLEVLLIMFLVTLATTIEGRSILYKTEGDTIRNRLLARRLFKYKQDVRGNQMLRPSINRSMVSNPNLQSSERSPWRRNRLQQYSKPFGYLPLDAFESQRRDNNKNTFSRENSIPIHARPVVKHLDQFRQRNLQVGERRYNEFLVPSTDGASIERRDSLAKNRPLVNANPGATKTIPPKRNTARKLSLTFDINGSRNNIPRKISVKAKSIRNIQLSRLINKAIIDMQKGGRKTRIIFSRNTRRPPVKAKIEVGAQAPKYTKSISSEQFQNLSKIEKAILNKHNDKITYLTPTTPSSVETATITEILGRQDSTNVSTRKQTTYIDNETQTSMVSPDVPVTMTTVAGIVLSPKESHKSTITNNSNFTTSVPANDVTTEEPDVADTPDVDNLVMTGTAFRNPFYSAFDYD